MLSEAAQEELTLRQMPPELLAIREEPSDSGRPISRAERLEREELIMAPQRTGGNQSKAAKMLGCHRNTIRTKIRYYGIVAPS